MMLLRRVPALLLALAACPSPNDPASDETGAGSTSDDPASTGPSTGLDPDAGSTGSTSESADSTGEPPPDDAALALLNALPGLDVPAYMGTWYQVALRNNNVSKTLDVSVTLDTATQNTQALWMVLTNGATTSADGTLAACYLINGTVTVTPYNKSPTATHGMAATILTTTYTTMNVGTKRTFRFSLDTSAITNWASQPAGWKATTTGSASISGKADGEAAFTHQY